MSTAILRAIFRYWGFESNQTPPLNLSCAIILLCTFYDVGDALIVAVNIMVDLIMRLAFGETYLSFISKCDFILES